MTNFSSMAKALRSSEIRRLMSLAADPSIISFAGGMPNNSLFPIDIVDKIWLNLPESQKQIAFQYGPTSGYPPLLAALTNYLQSRGIPTTDGSLIITTGAQQAISLLSRVMLDEGDHVVTEYPSFIGALAAFSSCGAILDQIPLDEEGIEVEALKKHLDAANHMPKMIYLNTHFHNPKGITYSAARKEEVLSLLENRSILVLEDDPYSELYFNEKDKVATIPMAATNDGRTPLCYVGSFAKILGPGMRLGWLFGPKEIVEKCELAKQSADACSSTLTQVIAAEFLMQGKLPPYLSPLRKIYSRRAQLMLTALSKHMPKEVSWTTPRGGFYVWATLPEHINATDVFTIALSRGAAFVVGSAFDPAGIRNNCFRLAFSHTAEEKIEKGIAIIAEAVKEVLAKL